MPPAVQKSIGRLLSECVTREDTLHSWERMDREDVARIKRLACIEECENDVNMKDAYKLLEQVFTEDWQWTGFIHSAWGARMKFDDFRKRRKQLNTDKEELASELRRVAKLLGNPINDETAEIFSGSQYLDAAQAIGEAYYLLPRGAPGAATSTREGTSRTDYLRTFAILIEFNHVVSLEYIHRTPRLRNAMAIVADVVLNNKNVAFSEKDVKQAVTSLLRSRRVNGD